MKIPSRYKANGPDTSSAMTPMIDIVFLLLIFFVCAAAGAVQEKVLATELAPTGSVQSDAVIEERDAWVLEIWLKVTRNAEGLLVIDVNGTSYTDVDLLEQQLAALAAIDPSNPVILDVSPGVQWGEIVDLYDRARRRGLQSIHFAANAADLEPQEQP